MTILNGLAVDSIMMIVQLIYGYFFMNGKISSFRTVAQIGYESIR